MILVEGKFWATEAMANTLDVLGSLRNGGMASIKGYKPTTDYVQVPTIDVQFISKFSTESLYRRKVFNTALTRYNKGDSLTDAQLEYLREYYAQALQSLGAQCVPEYDLVLQDIRTKLYRIESYIDARKRDF